MNSGETVVVKRGRGRPPKVKRGGFKNVAKGPAEPPEPNGLQANTTDEAQGTSLEIETYNTESTSQVHTGRSRASISQPIGAPDDDSLIPTGSKRASQSTQGSTTARKRLRPELPEVSEPSTPGAFGVETTAKSFILPARRSTRQTTVHSTQVSEGTLRPPGPPCLEAALSIALRNLESETWRYLWSYHEKNQGEPLPTPAAIKAASPLARRAAEAVDKAHQELEDAIDGIMRAGLSKKRRGGTSSRRGEKRSDTEPTPTPSLEIGSGSRSSLLGDSKGSGTDVTDDNLSATLPLRDDSESLPGTSEASTPIPLAEALRK